MPSWACRKAVAFPSGGSPRSLCLARWAPRQFLTDAVRGTPGELGRGQPVYIGNIRELQTRESIRNRHWEGRQRRNLVGIEFGEIWRGSCDVGCLEREKGIFGGQVQYMWMYTHVQIRYLCRKKVTGKVGFYCICSVLWVESLWTIFSGFHWRYRLFLGHLWLYYFEWDLRLGWFLGEKRPVWLRVGYYLCGKLSFTFWYLPQGPQAPSRARKYLLHRLKQRQRKIICHSSDSF